MAFKVIDKRVVGTDGAVYHVKISGDAVVEPFMGDKGDDTYFKKDPPDTEVNGKTTGFVWLPGQKIKMDSGAILDLRKPADDFLQ